MFIAAHLLAGLIIGKLTGHYHVAIVTSVIVDLDHLFPYFRHGIIFNPKKFLTTIFSAEDETGDQRSFLHFGFMWVLLSALAYWFFYNIFWAFSLSYLVHLILDMLDSSPFFPWYPFSNQSVEGPLRYLSAMSLSITYIGYLIYFYFIY